MTTWFDLPTEVKQMICEMVTDVGSITYVPRDRRYKVDLHYESAQHFHNILLVAKNFITPEELGFAILRKAAVSFHTANQLRRFLNEVNPAFRECIRRIHLNRTMCPEHDPSTATDSFESLPKIPDIFSAMPNLQQIHISWDDYCAPLGRFRPATGGNQFATSEHHFAMLKCALKGNHDDVPSYFVPEKSVDILGNAVASFVGNRRTGVPQYSTGNEPCFSWIRPHSWISRLVRHAEGHNIEIIFNVILCIHGHLTDLDLLDPRETYPGRIQTRGELCWCNRNIEWWNPYGRHHGYSEMHTHAHMSTKDYMLRVKDHEGKQYLFYQHLAYRILHAKPRAPLTWWWEGVAPLQYDGRHGARPRPRYAF